MVSSSEDSKDGVSGGGKAESTAAPLNAVAAAEPRQGDETKARGAAEMKADVSKKVELKSEAKKVFKLFYCYWNLLLTIRLRFGVLGINKFEIMNP